LKKEKDIIYSDKELLDLALSAIPEEKMVKITTFISSDIYLKLKSVAKEKGINYQSLLNLILRQAFFKDE